jgi:hypothetical protein
MSLWVFGDSYAEQYPNLKDQWMTRVANLLDTDVRSFGLVGSSVEFTYHSFNNIRNEIKENDIIILALTTPSRRWFFKRHPSHTAQPIPGTNYKEPSLTYNLTGFKEIDDALAFYEAYLNNHEVYKSYLQNFLYNLDNFTKKLNLHTIIIPNFYDTLHFLKDVKDQYPNIYFANGMMVDVSLNEFTKEYLIEYSTSTVDVRVNHLLKSNHIILADKIIDNIKNKSIIDLELDFDKHVFTKEKMNNKEFIDDQLFGRVIQ